MNSKNKIFSKIVLTAICSILLLSTNVFAIVEPTSNFYVNDYADLLNSETENYIMNVNQNLNSKTKAQVVVVTVNNLEGDSLEEYATELFRSFGIGDKTLNNGVLMLIALEERQSRIEVGYGLEGILNDAKTGRIQDNYMIPYLRENNWDEGIKNGFSAIVNEIEKEYGVTAGSETATEIEQDDAMPIEIVFLFISFIISMIVVVATNQKKNKLKVISVYFIFLIILSFIITRDIMFRIVFLIFNFFTLVSAFGSGRVGGGRYYGGGGFSSGGSGFSGGGFSGGGGSSGGGRKLKRFLKKSI